MAVTASPSRSTPAQQGPPASLAGIPVGQPAGTHWYREHSHRPASPDGGCWYYAPLPADPTTGGRFDLGDPEGTCYVANDPLVAAMERVGRFTAQGRPVPADLVDGRQVTTIETVSLPAKAVNLLHPTAATHYQVTGELFTMSDYSVPQTWAAAIRRAGHEALLYTPRFSASGQAIAVFGPKGAPLPPPPTVSTQPLSAVLAAVKVPVESIPAASALHIVSPPTGLTK